MNTILRISEVLHQKYGYYVPLREIGYESNLFYKDDLDENLVPSEVIEHLVEPFMTEAASYTDLEGNDYVVIQVETGDVIPYEIWIVNGELKKDFLEGLK